MGCLQKTNVNHDGITDMRNQLSDLQASIDLLLYSSDDTADNKRRDGSKQTARLASKPLAPTDAEKALERIEVINRLSELQNMVRQISEGHMARDIMDDASKQTNSVETLLTGSKGGTGTLKETCDLPTGLVGESCSLQANVGDMQCETNQPSPAATFAHINVISEKLLCKVSECDVLVKEIRGSVVEVAHFDDTRAGAEADTACSFPPANHADSNGSRGCAGLTATSDDIDGASHDADAKKSPAIFFLSPSAVAPSSEDVRANESCLRLGATGSAHVKSATAAHEPSSAIGSVKSRMSNADGFLSPDKSVTAAPDPILERTNVTAPGSFRMSMANDTAT